MADSVHLERPSGHSAAVARKLPLESFALHPARLDVPAANAYFREAHAGTNGKLVILLQDAHTNLSGQKNLAATLDHLLGRYDVPLVFVEGADKDATLDVIKDAAAPAEWKIAAKRFLYDGVISGDEYLNLTSDHAIRLLGVEYGDLYDLNVKAYADLKSNMEAVTRYLHRVDISLGRVKNKIYPKEALAYEALKNGAGVSGSFSKSQDRLLDFAAESDARTADYPQIRKLIELKKAEKAIDVANAPPQEYESYLAAFKDLQTDALMKELDRLEQDFYSGLFAAQDQRIVRAIDRYVELLRKAYTIRMSSDDFRSFLANEADFHTVSWQAFLNEKLIEFGFHEDILPFRSILEDAEAQLLNFYRIVDERDHAFVENAERLMTAHGRNAAFLIAGGYHTGHLTRLLREHGTSYAVLAPLVTDETDIRKYEQLLLASAASSRYTLNIRKLLLEPELRLERYAGGVYPISGERIQAIGDCS